MTWFKIDDGFYDHPKVVGLPMAARGLWLTAGAWCAKHLTDGVVPAAQVRALGGTPTQVRSLIQCGLWVESEPDVRPKSYAFHDWIDMQPSRNDVSESREREREKKRKWRERKAANQREGENVHRGQDRGQNSVSTVSSTVSRPDPTRPDPTRPTTEVVTGGSSVTAERATEKHPPTVSPALIAEPWRARCADHAGVDSPPPCRRCAAAREAAEAARAERDAAAARAADDRRAAVDGCGLCDANGLADGPVGLLRCPHDADELAALQAAAAAPDPSSETTGDQPVHVPEALAGWRVKSAARKRARAAEEAERARLRAEAERAESDSDGLETPYPHTGTETP